MNNGRIAVSVYDSHAVPLAEKVLAASRLADIVEIRFDYLDPSELFAAVTKLENLKLSCPLIATFRSKEQGGFKDVSVDERLAFWKAASGKFWAADLEEDIVDKVGGFDVRFCSQHEFSVSESRSESSFSQLSSNACDVVKIAEAIDDATDGIELWKTLEKAVSKGKHFIPVAMGEAGKWTRILGLAHGAYLTYSALENNSSTAPGQLTCEELSEVFRAKDLDKQYRVYGILAGSTEYTMSPYIHNAAFRSVGLNSVFVPLQIKDAGIFFRRMVRIESREVDVNFRGFSVTIPHKQSVIEYLDKIDGVAEAVGAVNTVRVEDGKLVGFNTDVEGFIAPLRKRLGDLKDCRAALVGSGGAARACIYALKKEGADVVVLARDEEKAKSLAEEFSAESVRSETQTPATFSGFDLIVNATPIGTTGLLENETVVTADEMRDCRLVYDLVYNPLRTRLIREAETAGVPAINGVEMLIAQGAKQFEIWCDRPAPMDVMKAAALKRLMVA